uniref:CAZy families CE1 protein n=1 Tax=uncultured Brachybacterium sp. TaxID=189680 RepID=A0A060CIK0_9MICO|nr:CAZy families CE1 protein [uncultured Brachybacterium sp.]
MLGHSPAEDLPALYVSCGRQDELLDHSERFLAAAGRWRRPRSEFPDGVHSWDLWDVQIQHVIDWLPLG